MREDNSFDEIFLKETVHRNQLHVKEKLESLKNSIDATALYLISKNGNTFTQLLKVGKHNNIELGSSFTVLKTPENNPESIQIEKNYIRKSKLICLKGSIECAINNESGRVIGAVIAFLDGLNENIKLKTGLLNSLSEQLSNYFQKLYFKKITHEKKLIINELMSASKTGVWEFDIVRDELEWSRETYNIYGINENTAITLKSAFQKYTSDSQTKLQKLFTNLAKNGIPYDQVLEIKSPNGEIKQVRTTGRAEMNFKGQVIRLFGICEELPKVTALSLYDNRFDTIFDQLNESLLILNKDGRILQCNQTASSMFGYSRDELINAHLTLLIPESHTPEYNYLIENLLSLKKVTEGKQISAQRINGETIQVELYISELRIDGEVQYFGLFHKKSEQIESIGETNNLSFKGSEGNLKNNQRFEIETKKIMKVAIEKKHYIHVMLIDIDNMASFNHRFGYTYGDKALKLIYENIQADLPEGYVLYKYDSDSFILISRNTLPNSEHLIFEVGSFEKQLLSSNIYEITIFDKTYALSASLGGAIFDPTGLSFETILSVLEHAVFIAKKEAPFGLCHMHRDGVEEYEKLIVIDELLHNASRLSEFHLLYQPQFNASAQIVSFEALIRWNSKELGLISPSVFIPIAEANGAIKEIGWWVIEEACSTILEMSQSGFVGHISINVSAKQLTSKNFATQLISILKQRNISPSLIMLELTETVLVTDIITVKQVMEQLAEKGILFSVDDFGTGYSSLTYLKELPIHELKIDKYFVDEIMNGSSTLKYPIVDTIINMAAALNVRCVAEGVEHKKQFDYLNNNGCTLFQGYFFSKPLPKTELINLQLTSKDSL